MRAFEIRDQFGLENLVLSERPEPVAGPGQVLVEVSHVSLNYRDLMMIRGTYNPRQRLPLIPASDGVGRVVALGSGVTRVAIGDRVAGNFAQGWISNPPTRSRLANTLGGPLDGMLAERVVLDAEGVVKVPAHLTDAEASTLPCAALTAWTAMFVEADVGPGSTVLVLGTGGVSIFALQFAVMAGATAIVTSSSDAKLERARGLGARHTINYREHPEWWRRVRQATEDEGVDLVVEVGGAGTLDQSIRSVRVGGTVALIGVLSGAAQELALTRVLMQNIRIQGVIVGCRDSFEVMNSAIAAHKLRPVIDSIYSLADLPRALEHLASGRHFGKVCVRVRE